MDKNKNNAVRRIVFTALLAALCCLATFLFRVPTPTGGYANLGDGFCLLAGFLLGPWPGAAAAGIGSALADLLAGCAVYAPGSLIVKAGVAVIGGLLLRLLSRLLRSRKLLPSILAGLAAELWMLLGYFFYESVCLGVGPAAAAELIGNAFQGLVGIVIAALLGPALLQVPYIRNMIRGFDHHAN